MIRHFTDARGTSWRVWDIWPTRRSQPVRGDAAPAVAAFPGGEFADGWLCFECDTEKRRLAPVPPEWETCEECVLEEMCARAGYTTPTPNSGMPGVSLED